LRHPRMPFRSSACQQRVRAVRTTWQILPTEYEFFKNVFTQCDTDHDGFITGPSAHPLPALGSVCSSRPAIASAASLAALARR
jgi:hypothetical protein